MPFQYIKKSVGNWIDDLRGRQKYRRYGEKENRIKRLTSQIVALLGMLSAIFYLFFCFYYANWEVWYVFIPFIVADISFFSLRLLSISNLWLKRYHNPQGLVREEPFTVDVFIPVYNEPLDIVEETIAAAAKLDYDYKSIYVLDDGDRDTLKTLTEKYGLNYIRRPEHKNSKAGNLNYAFKRTNGELILAIDADQVAKPELIKKIVGYFKIPRIAFVQTPQSFKLPKGDPWGNADTVFYHSMLTAKDYDNSAISCGTGVMYRRKALESVNGFSEWNVVEDLHTSLRIHDKGWHSIYYPMPMTMGTAPQDVVAHVKQRWHWAVDSLRMIFWDCPLTHKNLNWPQRLQYFQFGYNYLVIGVFVPFALFFVPQWALFTHKFILTIPPIMYILARLPYLIFDITAGKLLTDQTVGFKSNQAQIALFAVFFNAVFVALKSKNTLPEYTVTRKIAREDPFYVRLRLCLPHIIVMAISITAIVYGIMTIKDDFWFLSVNILVSSVCLFYLNKFIVLSLWPKAFIK
jgi:cellulose synthase (UDP-forming)